MSSGTTYGETFGEWLGRRIDRFLKELPEGGFPGVRVMLKPRLRALGRDVVAEHESSLDEEGRNPTKSPRERTGR